MRLARLFMACAATVVYVAATALLPTAAQASTCTDGSVTITLDISGSCGGVGSGAANFGGSGDVILTSNPSYIFLQSVTFNPIYNTTSGTFNFTPPPSYDFTSFIIAFAGQQGPSNLGWAFFIIPSAFSTGNFSIAGGPIITSYAFYGLPTPLPSSIILFATVLAGAWTFTKWRRRRPMRLMPAAA